MTDTDQSGAWRPLANPIYRRLWLAQVGANLGTWMQTVGAQWLIVSASGSALLVGLVQTASTLPMVLLAAPAGVLADILDRRRLLVWVQLSMMVAGAALAALTFMGLSTPGVVLGFTFLLGCGAALIWPAWQAIQPELVPRQQIPQASSLAAVNVNLARSVGPALGGILVAAVGAGWVFALNAASFLLVALAVASWNRVARPDPAGRERMIAGLRSGARFVRHSRSMRRVLTQSLLFVPAATALWALLPLVATQQLDLGAGGYGLLLGAMGVGAVVGSLLLPMVRSRVRVNTLITGTFVLYAAALGGVAIATTLPVAAALLAVAGAAWLGLLGTLNASTQLALPDWVRARGLSYYLVAVSVGQASGGFLWGALATQLSLRVTLLIAAGALVVLAVVGRWAPLSDLSRVSPTPTIRQLPPELDDLVDADAGPILVTIAYAVRREDTAGFVDAMAAVGRVRRRTGARRWGLFRDPAAPDQFLELFTVATWSEHRRQHLGRITVIDRQLIDHAQSFLTRPPVVRHLVAADAGDRSAFGPPATEQQPLRPATPDPPDTASRGGNPQPR
jgi:MFS family permease